MYRTMDGIAFAFVTAVWIEDKVWNLWSWSLWSLISGLWSLVSSLWSLVLEEVMRDIDISLW